MAYNEYIAPKSKVLFDINDFTYGNTVLSAHNLNLVILDKEEADVLMKAYQEKEEEIRAKEREENKPKEEVQENQEESNVAVMALNDEGEYEEIQEVKEQSLEDFKREHIAELLAKGIVINSNDIEIIKHG